MQLSTLCYIKKDSQTLMLHRIKRNADIHQGKWNGLGGKFEPGETPEECVKREVLEESGLSITNPLLHGYISFPKFKDNEDWFVFVFTATEFSGELIESDEGHLEWIADDQINHLPLWEGDPIFLKWIADKQFFSAKFEYVEKKLVNHSVQFYTLSNGSELPKVVI